MTKKNTLRRLTAWALVTLCLALLMFLFFGFVVWPMVDQNKQIATLTGCVTITVAAIIALPLTARFTRQ